MGNKIGQWKNKVPDNGVFTDSLVMSDHPLLGEWKIKAIQGVGLQLLCFYDDASNIGMKRQSSF